MAEQLEAALEASRREATEVSKLRAELAAAISSAEEAVKAKERAEELRLQVRRCLACFCQAIDHWLT